MRGWILMSSISDKTKDIIHSHMISDKIDELESEIEMHKSSIESLTKRLNTFQMLQDTLNDDRAWNRKQQERKKSFWKFGGGND